MAISVNWSTKVVFVPQSYLAHVSGTLYQLDTDLFRLDLKNIEDSEEGIAFLDTHRHSTQTTLSGVVYARIFEIINDYTITFEDTGTPYRVRCVGSNHNLSDVQNLNNVSLIVGNAAGLVNGGGGLTTEQSTMLTHLWRLLGLDSSNPVTTTTTEITATDIAIAISGNGETSTTLTRT